MRTFCFFLFFLFLSFPILAQPYLYFSIPVNDSTTLLSDNTIHRYNAATGLPEKYQAGNGYCHGLTFDPSSTFLLISFYINHTGYSFIFDTRDSSETELPINLYPGSLLYLPRNNSLLLFCGETEIVYTFDLSSKKIVSKATSIGFSDYCYIDPPRNIFFSSDSSRIYFSARDSITQTDYLMVYYIKDNVLKKGRKLSEIGNKGAGGYILSFGKNGIGIIYSYAAIYNSPEKGYLEIYNFDKDSLLAEVPVDESCESYFTHNGKYLLLFSVHDGSMTEEFYLTGRVRIFDTETGKLLKTLFMPQAGDIIYLDTYPGNIYYALNMENSPKVYMINADSLISYPESEYARSFELPQELMQIYITGLNNTVINTIHDVIKYNLYETKEIIEKNFLNPDYDYNTRLQFLKALRLFNSALTQQYSLNFLDTLENISAEELTKEILAEMKLEVINILFNLQNFSKANMVLEIAANDKNVIGQLLQYLLYQAFINVPVYSGQATETFVSLSMDAMSPEDRFLALEYLYKMGPSIAYPHIINAFLTDKDSKNRHSILAYNISKYTGREVEKFLLSRLSIEKDKDIRGYIAYHLLRYFRAPYNYFYIKDLAGKDKYFYDRLFGSLEDYYPAPPDSSINISSLIKSLSALTDSIYNYSWIGDITFVSDLKAITAEGLTRIEKGDTLAAAINIKMYLDSVNFYFSDSSLTENKFVSTAGWNFLFYNARYILDRLPPLPPLSLFDNCMDFCDTIPAINSSAKYYNSTSQSWKTIINYLLGKSLDKSIVSFNVESVLSLNASEGLINRYGHSINDPYNTLKDCILFTASSGTANDKKYLTGIVKGYRLIWVSDIFSSAGTINFVAADDLNLDGMVDLVAVSSASGKSNVFVFSWDGINGICLNEKSPKNEYQPVSMKESTLRLCDIDGDGKIEILSDDITNRHIPVWEWNGTVLTKYNRPASSAKTYIPDASTGAKVSTWIYENENGFVYNYTVKNPVAGKRRINGLLLAAKTGIVSKSSPDGWQFTGNEKQGTLGWQTIAGGSTMNMIPPGESAGGFTITTSGLPVIGECFIQNERETCFSNIDSESGDLYEKIKKSTYKTVAVLPLKADVPLPVFLDSLASYCKQSLQLGWIDGSHITTDYARLFRLVKQSLQENKNNRARKIMLHILSSYESDRRFFFSQEADALIGYNTNYLLNYFNHNY